jgi:hypothetical protein
MTSTKRLVALASAQIPRRFHHTGAIFCVQIVIYQSEFDKAAVTD